MTDLAGEATTLVDVLRLWAERRPDRPALVFLDGRADIKAQYDFARLLREADAIAARLLDVARPGDRALLLFPPGPEFVAAFFGCLVAGVIAVPASPPSNAAEVVALGGIALNAGASAAVGRRALLAQLTEPALLAQLAQPAQLVPLAFEECVASASRPNAPSIAADSVAFLQYTSGSTGRPRGVVVTHANLLDNERMIREAFEHDSERTVFAGWLPLYHDMGLIGNVLQPLYLGVPSYLLSPRDFMKRPLSWLQAISRYRATTSGGPSFAYRACVERVPEAERDGLDLASWDVAFNGAEPVRDDVIERFTAAYSRCGFRRESFYPCYGLAEATLLVTGGAKAAAPVRLGVERAALAQGRVVRVDDLGALGLIGCGHAWRGQEIAIVDPDTRARCPDERVGEIWIRGGSVAHGYFGDREMSDATFGARLAGEDGAWLRTGDLGFFAEGHLFIAGRAKDVIIVRGKKHHPEDLERTIERASPALRPGGGAAFSVDSDGEERLVVVHEIERKQAAEFDAARTAADIREVVAAGHGIRVHAVAFVAAGAVPRTTSGKVRRRQCRSQFLDGTLEELGERR
jgi:acyl-CoA synthetase (AMP-forming)/AMP-acid ligase II